MVQGMWGDPYDGRMAVERVKVAVLGLGAMGTNHAKAYAALPEADLVALVEPHPERARAAQEAFGMPVYGSVEELVAEADFDAASVATPDQHHVHPALVLAAAGKHILMEKPLATTVADCDTIIKAAAEAGVKLMLGFTLRFDPRYYLVQRAVAAGEIGEPVYMYARRNNLLASARRVGARVSLPFFLQVHDIDAMRWIGGAEVTKVYASAARKVHRELGTDDVVLTNLHFDDGSVGLVESNWILPDHNHARFDFRLEVVGTQGHAAVDLERQGASIQTAERSRELDPMFQPVLYRQQPLVLREEVQHFIACVREDSEPVVGGADGRAATAVALAIERSLQTGQAEYVAHS